MEHMQRKIDVHRNPGAEATVQYIVTNTDSDGRNSLDELFAGSSV